MGFVLIMKKIYLLYIYYVSRYIYLFIFLRIWKKIPRNGKNWKPLMYIANNQIEEKYITNFYDWQET